MLVKAGHSCEELIAGQWERLKKRSGHKHLIYGKIEERNLFFIAIPSRRENGRSPLSRGDKLSDFSNQAGKKEGDGRRLLQDNAIKTTNSAGTFYARA